MKRRIIAIPGLLLLHVLLAHGQWNLEYFINAGKDKIMHNEYLAAINYFNKVIRVRPDVADAYYLRAVSKYNLNDYRGAIEDFTTAITLTPNFSYYYLYRGDARQRLFDYKGALEDYNKAIEFRINNPDAYIARGIISVILKKQDEAISDFNMALMFDRKSANAYLFRAVAKQYKTKYEDAMGDFTMAIQLDPDNADAYIKRGRNLCDMKKYHAAIEDFDRAIKRSPGNSLAYFNRAITKYEILDYTGAMKDYDKVIELDPENDLTYYNRAELKAKVGDLRGAIDDYNHVTQINPTNIYTYFNRGITWHKLNNFRKAIADYTSAINLNPEFAPAYYNRSIAKNSINDHAGAEIDHRVAMKIKASLRDSTQMGSMDSLGLAKLIEFKADFETGNVAAAKNNELGTNPFPIFAINYMAKDTLPSDLPQNEKLAALNNALPGGLFSISLQNDLLQEEKAAQMLGTLNSTHIALTDKEGLMARALLEVAMQNYNGAMDDFDRITKFNPNFSLAYFCRANTRYEINNLFNPENNLGNNIIYIDASNTMPQARQKQAIGQDYSEVVADYKKCLQLDPQFYYAYYNLANVTLKTKDFWGAIKNYTKAIAIEPKFSEAYYNRGLTYIYIQEKEKGCSDMSKAGELGVKEAYSMIKRFCNK